MLPPPTQRQLTILYYLSRWLDANAGASPSFRELAAEAGCRSVRTVTEHVTALRRKKLVTHHAGESRALFLTPLGIERLKTFDATSITRDDGTVDGRSEGD